MGALPRLRGEGLAWLAVDEAARGVLEVGDALGRDGVVGTGHSGVLPGPDHTSKETPNLPIYHILNPDSTRTWDDLLVWACKLQPSLEILEPREWIARLEDPRGRAGGHPARKLVGLWKGGWCGGEGGEGKGDGDGDGDGGEGDGEDIPEKTAAKKADRKAGKKAAMTFNTANAKTVSKTMRAVKPVSEEAFGRMWTWIGVNVGVGTGEGDGEREEDGEVEIGGR